MEKLTFLGSSRFLGMFSLFTTITLTFSIIFSILAATGIILFQSISSVFAIMGIIFIFGQIILTISYTNKKDNMGWILHRLSYISLILLVISFILITIGTYMTSFYILGENSLSAGAIIASISLTLTSSFGLILSSLGYYRWSAKTD